MAKCLSGYVNNNFSSAQLMAFDVYTVRPNTLEMKMGEMRQSLVFTPTLHKEINVKYRK